MLLINGLGYKGGINLQFYILFARTSAYIPIEAAKEDHDPHGDDLTELFAGSPSCRNPPDSPYSSGSVLNIAAQWILLSEDLVRRLEWESGSLAWSAIDVSLLHPRLLYHWSSARYSFLSPWRWHFIRTMNIEVRPHRLLHDWWLINGFSHNTYHIASVVHIHPSICDTCIFWSIVAIGIPVCDVTHQLIRISQYTIQVIISDSTI